MIYQTLNTTSNKQPYVDAQTSATEAAVCWPCYVEQSASKTGVWHDIWCWCTILWFVASIGVSIGLAVALINPESCSPSSTTSWSPPSTPPISDDPDFGVPTPPITNDPGDVSFPLSLDHVQIEPTQTPIFVVDFQFTQGAVETLDTLQMGMPAEADVIRPSFSTHGDRVAWVLAANSDAPMIAIDLVRLGGGGMWYRYINVLRAILHWMQTSGHDKCIINHSWGGSYAGIQNHPGAFETEEQQLFESLTAQGCIHVAAAANQNKFEVCEAEIPEDLQGEQWTGFEEEGWFNKSTGVAEDFPQLFTRGTGLIVGMYDDQTGAFRRPNWLGSERHGGFGPCADHAPGVSIKVGPDDQVATGTSFATPLVSATLEQFWRLFPTETPQKVVHAFRNECFEEHQLHNTPFPLRDILFDFVGYPKVVYSKRNTTRPTRILKERCIPQ